MSSEVEDASKSTSSCSSKSGYRKKKRKFAMFRKKVEEEGKGSDKPSWRRRSRSVSNGKPRPVKPTGENYKKYHKNELSSESSSKRKSDKTRDSFGIILCRPGSTPDQRLYLCIRRKKEIGYEELVRGHWDLENLDLLRVLFKDMTLEEQECFAQAPTFEQLWSSVWQHESMRCIEDNPSFLLAMNKWLILKRGYWISSQTGQVVLSLDTDGPSSPLETFTFMSMSLLSQDCKSDHRYPALEFPKGRKEKGENPLDCAKREFYEETNIGPDQYDMLPVAVQTEVFTGLNKIKYKYIYHVAQLKDHVECDVLYNENNMFQKYEVSHIGWYTFQQLNEMIRPTDVARRQVLATVHDLLNKL